MMSVDDDFEFPIPKRQRLEGDHSKSGPKSSRLFAPFRTLGLVSPTLVPFTSIPLGKSTFQITTSVGRSLQTYDLRRGLSLVFLSRPQCPSNITAIHAYRDKVFVAWGGKLSTDPRGIWVLKRGRVVAELEVTETFKQEIQQIIVLGSWIIGCGQDAVEVWKTESYEHYTTLLPQTHVGTHSHILTGKICTLPTFLNKVFVGRQDGNVEIYNVSTARLVHTILAPSVNSGPVTAITPAPALSLIAIAYADGSITVHDVEFDEQILIFHVSSEQAVTSISFRTDGLGAGEDGSKEGIMATASIESGDITIWDLSRGGKVAGVLRNAHEVSGASRRGGITRIEFLPGQPVIVSSGLDNSLRTWVFDQKPFSPIPRPLHVRSGHSSPVTKLKFLPSASDGSEAAGKWLLSAGQDRSLWAFSLRKDSQNTELSQGNVKHKAKKQLKLADGPSTVEDLKAPPIVDIACSLNRDGGMGAIGGQVWTNVKHNDAEESAMTGWESIVTAHADDPFARTWFWGRKKAGRWAFETSDKKPVTSVAITACGTFALIGSAGGKIDMFNLQSGNHRQRFPPRPTPAQLKSAKMREVESVEASGISIGHKDAVTGIVVDQLNQTVLSASRDGVVHFWDFRTGKSTHTFAYEAGAVTSIRYNPASGLVALSCDDLCIRVVDMETRKTVRELWGCVGQIYDLCFSHDGRWIVACSMDSVIRIFDLSTGHLIDAFKTTTCTSIAFSSTGEFLATTHAGNVGINIWNNKSLFTHVNTTQVNEDTSIIDLTAVSEFEATNQLALEEEDRDEAEQFDQLNGVSEIDQLDAALLTLSLVPQSRWQTLLNLETIRQRNKPVQPPAKPKAAPFFLGSSIINNGEIEPLNGSKNDMMKIDNTEQSRISRLASQPAAESALSTALSDFSRDPQHNTSEVVDYLKSLNPSAADLEIRSLTIQEMPIFVRALTSQLERRRDYELVNTWMSVFLKMHGDFISELDDLRVAVLDWRVTMQEEEKRLNDLVGYTKGVVEFLRSAR